MEVKLFRCMLDTRFQPGVLEIRYIFIAAVFVLPLLFHIIFRKIIRVVIINGQGISVQRIGA